MDAWLLVRNEPAGRAHLHWSARASMRVSLPRVGVSTNVGLPGCCSLSSSAGIIPAVSGSVGAALGRRTSRNRMSGEKRLETLLGTNVHHTGELALEEEFVHTQPGSSNRVWFTVTTVQVGETPCIGTFRTGSIHGEPFAFSEDTGAPSTRTVIVAGGQSGTYEELGGAGIDLGQHRSATSQSAAWKVSRWRSCSWMDSRLQAAHRQ